MDGIPKSYFTNDTLLVNSDWVQELLVHRRLPSGFTRHPNFEDEEVEAYLLQSSISPLISGRKDWEVFSVDRYPRKSSVVCPLPPETIALDAEEEGACFADVLQFVSHSNFSNLWTEAFSRFSSAWNVREKESGPVYGMEWDRALIEVLSRVHRCPVIESDFREGERNFASKRFSLVTVDKSPLSHVSTGLAIIVSSKEVFLLRRFSFCSVLQSLRFTPVLFEDSYLKPLFIVYQILLAAKSLHVRGVYLGDISLHDIYIDENYLVQVRPQVLENLRVLNVSDFEKANNSFDVSRRLSGAGFEAMSSLSKDLLQSLMQTASSNDSKQNQLLSENFLGSVAKMWASGKLSNFDYIMLLNYLCGRTFSNPNHYPVLPWVRDFTSHVGGWRDLTKSKYRLNKGDTQLDLTYENVPTHQEKDILSQPSCPHHVSDVLSEITYYVYKARRTPKSVLCRHVRSRWVPAEYPSSMQRLQEWTPDESIPDFFTDPSIFSSTHEDLPDLGLPAWCSSAEEFISWHRASLESDQVSEKLHCWIDLTFGYKLSGPSAIRAKNVCLPLIDNHADLRISGVVQLFTQPHPARKVHSAWWSKLTQPRMDLVFANQSGDSETDNGSGEDVGDGTNVSNIALPKDYDSVLAISDLESINGFAFKSNSAVEDPDSFNAGLVMDGSADVQARLVRDMQVIGCLIMEIFQPKKFLSLGRHANLKSRYNVCVSLLRPEQISSVPSTIREVAQQLLQPGLVFELDNNERYPTVSNDGRPPPTPGQLLAPLLSSLSFPKYFSTFARLLRQLDDIDQSAIESRRSDPDKWEENKSLIQATVSEMKVKLVAAALASVIEEDLKSEDLDLILPCIKRLFKDQTTSVMAAWHLFEPVSKILGPVLSAQHFLESILRIYESGDPTAKHLKLYHRSFLLTLIVCFGTKTFLKYFTENVIEAVGGYKDFDHPPPTGDGREGLVRTWCSEDEVEVNENSSDAKPVAVAGTHDEFSEGEVFAFEEGFNSMDGGPDSMLEDLDFDLENSSSSNDFGPIYVPSSYDDMLELWLDLSKSNLSASKSRLDGNISQIAAESVIWLAHRLGPVLTAKYLSKNLLKMLNLCYVGPKSYTPVPNDQKHPDSQIRISSKRTEGDALADNVLECLRELACLYGEQFILLQYLPYAWDLVSSCKRKKNLGCNVEGGLLGCLSMVRHCITCLSDSVLMNELSENLLSRIFNPVLELVTNPNVVFSGGWQQRQMLAYKLLDAVYMIGLRIGEEMARSLLTEFCSDFFAAFDKVHNNSNGEENNELNVSGSGLSLGLKSAAFSQMSQVMTPDLAYAVYVTFFHLMGRAHLDSSIANLNLLRRLCVTFNDRNTIRVATFAHFRTQKQQYDLSPGGSSSGNKIGVITSYQNYKDLPDLNGLIKKEISSTSRHLRGSWLAYWEHEIGRVEKLGFDLKQMKLQTFTGHTAGVRYIHVLDNENSFLSGSRDKTVKVWSLRSKGDGGDTQTSQWTYNLHKKSINSLTFLDGLRLVASCDSSIHIWDPFVGSGVHQIDGSAAGRLGGPVTVMTPMSPPSSCLILAATQHDGLLHLIDCRVGQVVIDMKVCIGSAGLVRCLCAHPLDPNTVTVGHSSGFISQLDTRTGKLQKAWKAHEGEILTLTPIRGNDFVSSSLDQTVNVWEGSDGKLRGTLPGPQEPIHCVAVHGDEVITGSTANSIVVRRKSTSDSPFTSNRLRPDILKGNLLSMNLVPMNRLLLLGIDNGNIRLVC